VVVDFLDFVRRHGRGRLLTPTAVVIDREGFCLDTYFLAGLRKKWLGFYEPTAHQQATAAFFRHLIGHKDSPPNDDARVLPPSPMPDAFDVVLDDASAEFLWRYAVLAYVGQHPDRLRRRLRGYPGELILVEEPSRTAQAVTEATLDRLPLRVEGPVNWLLCRKGRALQVGIFNPSGVTTDFHKGEQSDPGAAAEATISGCPGASRARLTAAWPEGTRIRAAADRVGVTVGPGGLAVVEIPL
jgi:hypothetical protein